jgi:hypothetical protein
MMIEGVAFIDRPLPFDVHRTMHDESVHRPLEHVGEQERQRHGQPLQPGDVVNVRGLNIERRAAHRVDDQDQPTIRERYSRRNAFCRSVIMWLSPVGRQPTTDNGGRMDSKMTNGISVVRHQCISLIAPSISASVNVQSLSRSEITFRINGSDSAMARSLSLR